MAIDAHQPGLRIVLYSHDSVGLGHTRRNLAIAHALSAALPALTGRRVSGLLITGERTATSYACPEGWDWVVMPGIAKGDAGYTPRTLNVGMSRLMGVRSAVIDAALRTFRPHVMLVDRHAFGVDGELRGPLERLKSERPQCQLVLGLRDVLDAPEVAQREWAGVGLERVTALFDQVWVYGDPAVHDGVKAGELPVELIEKIRFTGYLAQGRQARTTRRLQALEPYVVTMAGGGADGFELTARAAQAPVPTGYRHLIVTGPQMPAESRAEVRALAGERTEVRTTVPDGLACLRAASAAVVMGGYNTVCEALSTGTPTLVVPREVPRTEQLIRARSLHRRGAIDLLRQGEASPERLGAWLEAAVVREPAAVRTPREGLDTGGLARVVDYAQNLTSQPHREELNRVSA
ncbi:glycosyltransferase family protein [Zhihengliuella flava]|uniref:Glycosyltransferase n=1 Tax=Zhihengliuella flava TaxID=1285193 RepID=A0A931DD84_9MICC|nr:glycosyltransferase [Zhihengliuella flava]MBG6085331.1 putative glycosyltransferase [Zhihengliuella flava]